MSSENNIASFVAEAMAKDAARRTDASQSIPGVAPNWGQYAIPHVLSFQSIFGSIAKVYRPTDEALKNSLDNSRFMRNDCGIMECIEARQRAVALLGWHLEPEDEKNPREKQLCEDLTRILRRIKRFTDYRYNLLHALWYGRYGIQQQYNEVQIGNRTFKMPHPKRDDYDGAGWLPVNGDKIVFRYDDGRYLQGDGTAFPGQVGIRVGGQWKPTDKINGRWNVEYTDRGMAYFLNKEERRLLVIHKHMIEDGAFEAGLDAGMIHGVGIRSRIYWDWFQKQEALAFLMEYLERSAGGIELWYYDEGNPESKRQTEEAATQRIGNKRNVILVPRPRGEDAMAYGVQVVEPGMAGIESLKDILTNYFGHRIKRYILGQVLTSEAEATGLGSGVADAHLDTLMQIIQYDARGLDETLTDQLVQPIKEYNFPEFRNVHIRYKTETEAADLEKKLDGWQRAYEMGCKLKERDVMDLIGAESPGPDDRVLQHPQFTQVPGMGGPGGTPGDPSGGPSGGGPGAGPVGPGGGLHPTTVAVAAKASEETARALFGEGSRPETEHYAKTADEAAAETEQNPSDEQKATGNYRKGKFRLHGLSIAIETPKGAERRGKNRDGQAWSVTMPVHYGYILRTEGRDGDHVDCFVGPNPESEIVYVVDQTTPGGRFDEHKCLIGFMTEEDAVGAYLASYSDDAVQRVRDVTAMTVDQFKAWLGAGDTREPVAEQVSRYAKKSDATGQKRFEWITIGGAEEGGKKHAGGTPVKIETSTGKIVAGPHALAEKGIQKLSDFGKPEAERSGNNTETKAASDSGKSDTKEPESEGAAQGTSPKSDTVGAGEEGAKSQTSLFSEAVAKGDSPREAADKAARPEDAEYEFARQSSVRNAGEDLKGSARHKVNAWRGLAEAEADGTAAQMVTRDNLLKAEPHGLMDHVGRHPLTAMAMHLALKKLPPAPGYGDERRRSRLSEEEKRKDREQYLEAYRSMREKAEEIARTQDDPLKALSSMRGHVMGLIRKFRGQSTEDTIGAATAADRYNNTANALVNTLNTLGSSAYDARKSTNVVHALGQFASNMKNAYPDLGAEDRREKAIEHASDVIEGASVAGAFGQSSKKGGDKKKPFDASEAYVKHAVRKGGPDLSEQASDPNKATAWMVDSLGMRGVQWGNSVTDDERKHHARMVAEAFADLTDILGIDPKDASLGGKLGLAIGARGKGTASAHYEPGSQVINLTRKSGVGALAHEWGHGFDHMLSGFEITSNGQRSGGDYFSERVSPTRFVMEKGSVKVEGGRAVTEDVSSDPLWKAYDGLRKTWMSSGFRKRLGENVSAMVRGGQISEGKREYWTSNREIFARSFERYVQRKLEKSGRSNTYLAGLMTDSDGGKLWPNDAEVDAMAPHFDAIFEAFRATRATSPTKYSRDELVRHFLAEIDRYELTPAEIEKAQGESTDTAPKKSSRGGKGGKWVKLGGGAPAFVGPDGTIKKGCPGLKGENVDDLIDEPDESRDRRKARQAHAEASGLDGKEVSAKQLKSWEGKGAQQQHEAAARAAKYHDVPVADVLAVLPEALQVRTAEWERTEAARASARRSMGLNASNLGKIENAYRDYSSVPGFDDVAASIAMEFPEMGFGRTGDVSAEVWDFIREGSQPKPRLHDDETAEMAAQMLGRKSRGKTAEPEAEPWGGDEWADANGDDQPGDGWGEAGSVAGDDSFEFGDQGEALRPEDDWRENGTRSKAFKSWFGGSKIVDNGGNPLVLYHGTKADRPFEAFDPSRGGEFGIYMTPRRRYAEGYGKGKKPLELFASIRNPLIVENKGEISPRDLTRDDILELEAKGYDGIVVVNQREDGSFDSVDAASEIVAFRPNQVKSSVSNRGTFDPNDDRMNYARRVQAAVDQYAAKKKSAEGQQEFRWVTIGGSAGEKGQHEGGTPVKIETATGKIVGGPKALADKGIQKLSDFGEKGGDKIDKAAPNEQESGADSSQPANPFRQQADELQRKIDRLQGGSATDRAMEQSFPLGTGRPGNASSRRTSKQWAKSIDKTIDDAKKATELIGQKNSLLARADEFGAGRIDASGKPTAQAVSESEQKAKSLASAKATMADYYRETLKPGDMVHVAANPNNAVEIKRVNKNGITAQSGSTWKWDEIIPRHPEGRAMSPREAIESLKAWRQGKDSGSGEPTAKPESESPKPAAAAAPSPAEFTPKIGDIHEFPELGGRSAMKVRVSSVSSDKVGVGMPGSDATWVQIPKESFPHFLQDMTGKISVPADSGNPHIDRIARGEAKLLGKGDDGLVFDTGDGKVTKVSTTVPFQPLNPFHRTPEEARQRAIQQFKTAKDLHQSGVPGIPRMSIKEHGDRVFTTRENLKIPEKLTQEQLRQVRDSVRKMHDLGYAVNDEIQVGIGADGNVYHFDLGKVDKIEHADQFKSDQSGLDRMAEKHGLKPLAINPQKEWGEYQEMLRKRKAADDKKGSDALTRDFRRIVKDSVGRLRDQLIAENPERAEQINAEHSAMMGEAQPTPRSPFPKPTIPGQQSSLFGGDDLKTGQKALFNVARPAAPSRKPATPDILASVTAEVRDILARKETISPADLAGTAKQAESLEGQKDLFARVRDSVEQYLKRTTI